MTEEKVIPPIKILVVDDDKYVLESLLLFLSDQGYRVVRRATQSKPLSLLRQETYRSC